MSETIWMTYCPEDGYEEYGTEQEGRDALDGLLDVHRDWASDGVHEDVESVALFRCERVAHVKQTVTATAEDKTEDGKTCRERGWDFMVELDVVEDSQ